MNNNFESITKAKRKIKILNLFFLLLLFPSVSAYENIPVIGGYYDSPMVVNLHLGDNTDNDLMPPEPTELSYTYTFSLNSIPKRQEVRLILTTVNVQPSAAKNESEYNDLVYINEVVIGRLNDKTGTDKQDYSARKMEFIFSSDLLNQGVNRLKITSGSNLDGTNYDDFAISAIYMEQYGKVRHWLFSYVEPEIVVLILFVIMFGLAVFAYKAHKRHRLPEKYQLILGGGLGAIIGIILIIYIQNSLLILPVLLFLVGGTVILMAVLVIMTISKYLYHKSILPSSFLFLLRPLIFLILTLIFLFISYQYLYFDPGGPQPTYGVPIHRPKKE